MNAITVELRHRDEERAGGLVRIPEAENIPWTAICDDEGRWYVVLHGQVDSAGSAALRLILDRIKECLELRAAAA